MGQLSQGKVLLFSLFWFNLRISLTVTLTNTKVGREKKLCDPTNVVMVKITIFLGVQQITASANTFVMEKVMKKSSN